MDIRCIEAYHIRLLAAAAYDRQLRKACQNPALEIKFEPSDKIRCFDHEISATRT